jgi:hypothetical protein
VDAIAPIIVVGLVLAALGYCCWRIYKRIVGTAASLLGVSEKDVARTVVEAVAEAAVTSAVEQAAKKIKEKRKDS